METPPGVSMAGFIIPREQEFRRGRNPRSSFTLIELSLPRALSPSIAGTSDANGLRHQKNITTEDTEFH